MAFTSQQVANLKAAVRSTHLPLTRPRRTNVDVGGGVIVADTGARGGNITADYWNAFDAVIDAIAAAVEPNTDVNVNAANFATRLRAQLALTVGGTSVSASNSGDNTTFAITSEHLQDALGSSFIHVQSGNTLGATYNDTANRWEITIPQSMAGGAFTWPSSSLSTVENADEILIQDDTDDAQKSITFQDFRTALNIPTSGGGGTFEYLNYRAINSSDISGNSTTITSAWVNRRNTFRGTSLSANHTVSMANGVGTTNQVLQITNEDADNTVTVSGDISDVPDGQDPVLQKFEWIQLQKISTGWRIVERGSLLSPTGSMSGTPDNAEQYWWGHQDSIPDGTWETTDAQDSQDVRTAGTTFTINITGIVDQDYYYFIAPNDRLPTRIVDGVGADRTTGTFTTVALADLIGTTDFTAYYARNVSGYTLPIALTITTA